VGDLQLDRGAATTDLDWEGGEGVLVGRYPQLAPLRRGAAQPQARTADERTPSPTDRAIIKNRDCRAKTSEQARKQTASALVAKPSVRV
jgi:hypothetical protein